ncbi:MAG: hypothetical protein GY801_08870 [bacterium]|nr:hypothetical protein [bacterium]
MAILDQRQINQDLQLIEENINLLDKRYHEYCEGVISLEPKALRAQTDALVRKWWGKPVASTQARFRLQNVVQRFNSYKEKWGRQLRTKLKQDKENEL